MGNNSFAKAAVKHLEMSVAGRATREEQLRREHGMTHSEDSMRYAMGGLIPKNLMQLCGQGELEAMQASCMPEPVIIGGDFEVAFYDEKELKRNWSVTVPHKDMFCADEVLKYVTRENPLAIINFNSDTVCFIHDSLVFKASLIEDIPFANLVRSPSYYGVHILANNSVHFQEVIAWARRVKKAAWGKARKEETVRVIIPKI